MASGVAHAQVPSFIWATHAGGTQTDNGLGLAIDPEGNAFVTGYFEGTATFGTTNLTSQGLTEVFVAKHDATGRFLWARQAGGSGQYVLNEGFSVAVDGTGNCYITGRFAGTASFGLINLVGTTNFASTDIFVAKYDGDGNLLWARQAGGDTQNGGMGIVVDTNGNSYVTGFYTGDTVFGNVTLTSTGPYPDHNIFLVKYDSDGNVLWARQAGGYADGDFGRAVALDGHGNVWVAGDVGTSVNAPNLFLTKYDGNGNRLWATSASASGQSHGYGVAADGVGNVFLAGSFGGSLGFDGVILGGLGVSDGLLAKCDASGNLLWVTQIAGDPNSSVQALAVAADTSGNSFVCGSFSGTLNTPTTNLVSVGLEDGFVAKCDPAGNVIWIAQMGTGGGNVGDGVAWCPGKGIYVTGGFGSECGFGSTILDSNGGLDMFLTRIDEMPILSVTNTASNVLLSWPTNQVRFVLERTGSMTPPVVWSTNNNPVQVSGDYYVVADPFSATNSFYRLWKP